MGQVYYNMGLLASSEVIECSASDLVAQFVGQTGPKTRKMFEKALGRVLFIDEAYRLAEGHFAQEAMDEIVALLTNERYRGKLIVILAGYDEDMNRLMSVNSGLSSRFPTEMIFKNLAPSQCMDILRRQLSKEPIDIQGLEDGKSAIFRQMSDLFAQLSALPHWGNARDVGTLAKSMTRMAYSCPTLTYDNPNQPIVLPSETAIQIMEQMLQQQEERLSKVSRRGTGQQEPVMFRDSQPPAAPSAPQFTTAVVEASISEETEGPPQHDGRDPGVSDEVWEELQRRKAAEQAEEQRVAEELTLLAEQRNADERKKREADELVRRLREANAATEELMRAREAQRLAELAAKEARRRDEEARERAEARRKEEARIQAKIREMGVCPVGYRWIKCAGGYRCAGGSHSLSDSQLGI